MTLSKWSFCLTQPKLPAPGFVPDKVYERALYKTFSRAFGAIVLLVLNVALVGSTVVQIQAHQRMNWQLEGVTYLAILFFDIAILRQVVFEVRKVSLWKDRIALDTLLWHTNLTWDEILEFKKPGFISIAVIKTKKVAYRLNKRDFAQFPELLEKLEEKLPERTK